jgi:predicted TIM-barrel fold metal-dependent hydrolase
MEAAERPPEDVYGVGDNDKLRGRDFLLEDYVRLAASYEVVKVVHVTAAQKPPSWPAETAVFQEMYETSGHPHGIIGWTDFARPIEEVNAELGKHMEYPNFRGVRHHDGIDYTSEHTAACMAVMQRRGLIYDVVAHEDALPAAAELAQRFDEMTFILEHTGWPTATDDETFRRWRKGIEEFADSPNTAVKISGLGMVIRPWTIGDFRPWVEAAIEIFGHDRCMFASNFPVDWRYSDFDALIEAFSDITSGASASERDALFRTNAEHWYRI